MSTPHGTVATPVTPPGYKPREIDEPVDYWVHRPLASLLVPWLQRFGISTRAVTVASGASGLAAGIVLGLSAPDGTASLALAAVLLLMSIVLDCADGQLARIRGEDSLLGLALDGTMDVVPIASIFFGFAAYLTRCGFGDLHMWSIGWAAGFSFRWQIHSYELAKNMYVQATGPDGASAIPTSEEVEALDRQCRSERDWLGMVAAMMLRVYVNDQRHREQQRRAAGDVEPTSPAQRDLWVRTFGPTMRLWSWNGLGIHLQLFIVTLLVSPWFHGAALVLFWILVVPMNLATLLLRLHERRLDRQFVTGLSETS